VIDIAGLEIVVLFVVCGAVATMILALALYFTNINIFQVWKQATKEMPQQYYNEHFTLYDVSPTKICILRVPETGFEAQVTQFALFWNGHVAFVNNGQIVYTVDDKKSIEPDDPLAFVRGDDTYVIKVITHGEKVIQNMKMETLMAQNSILRGEVKEMQVSLKDALVKYGETMRESRKSLNWNPQSGFGGGYSPLGYRRPFFGGGGGGDEGGEGGGDI
jgi:hypothetical protein